MKEILKITLFSILGGALSLIGYTTLVKKEANKDFKYNSDLANVAIPVKNYSNENSEAVAENIDFTTAAEKTIHAVVHVTNTTSYRQPRSIFEYYNNQGEQIQKGSTGSGVVTDATACLSADIGATVCPSSPNDIGVPSGVVNVPAPAFSI